ncbi:DUF3592 domain-containing protein [Kitasatospora sp. NPDC059577]|uniref:DUF3592 domain-containing protein n=1 Tax=Kitasatospora sp. NPDC059577 TaxID=3346873 RepID=UPI0036917882
MTTDGPTGDRLALRELRMGFGRTLATACSGLLCAGAGWLLSTAVVLIGGPDDCEVPPCHGGPITVVQLLGGILAAVLGTVGTALGTGRATPGSPRRLPLAPVLLVSLAVALLGAARTGGRTHPWLLATAALALAVAVPAAVLARPRLARQRRAYLAALATARRLEAHGVSTVGTVTATETLRPAEDHKVELRLTVRYLTPDGTGHTRRHTGTYPVHDAPRAGSRIAVRYDPRDPATAAVGAPRPDTAPPRDARPPLTAELERLAALHREGSLDATEFERAKAALLDGRG